MSEDEVVRWASARLREQGRTHEAALVETAARRGQPHRVRGVVRELRAAQEPTGAGGVAAMQQHPVHGGPPGASSVAPAAAADGADLAALQAFQREEPDPAA